MTVEEALTQLRLGPGINEDVTEDYNDAVNMAITALELVEYIEQRYVEEFNERRKYYADGRYHSLSICDGASYALRQVLDKWKESVEDKE